MGLRQVDAGGAGLLPEVGDCIHAEPVGASLEVMDRDARRMRGARPFVFTNLKSGEGLDTVIRFVVERGMLGARRERAPAVGE